MLGTISSFPSPQPFGNSASLTLKSGVCRSCEANDGKKHRMDSFSTLLLLRGGCETSVETRDQMDASVQAFLRCYGIVGRLLALIVIYSADTGSVSLGMLSPSLSM